MQAHTGYWAYIDVFFALMLISAAAIPLALILRRVKLH
ncbi:Inner membrane component of tripartite multidrug resistance system [Azospirillum largimobile]